MPAPPPPPPSGPEEFGHADDSVIARAFRGSAIALALIAVLGAGIYAWMHRKKPAPATQITAIAPPIAPAAPTTTIPKTPFTDITATAGIRFQHNNGATGEKLLPETMGAGAGFFDFDNDGHQDILFVNGTAWPWSPPGKTPASTAALYHNDGAGRFTDVTQGSGLDIPFQGMGVAIGDFDNDGLRDVLLTGVGGCRLFKNLGAGKFRDITASAGVAGNPQDWATASAWLDIDNDGDLDLFVANYVRWTRAIDFEVNYTLVGLGRAYGPPMNFGGSFPCLYRNNGDGTFTDISATSGIQIRNPATGVPAAKSLGVAPVDLNNDGLIDLVVANDTVQNFVFINAGNGVFKEVGASSGVAFDNFGNARGAMGIDTARYRNDRALGIGIGNFANEMTALYVSSPNQPMLFTDETIGEGVGPLSRLPLKFGLFFFDYDLDGWLDLLTVNGHLEEEISKVQQSQRFRQAAQLFLNNGAHGGGFLQVTAAHAGDALFQPIVGRGSAYADIDNDGDLDALFTQSAGPPLLLRNDQQLHRHWVRLKLVGTRSNRDAIGAWATLKLGDRTLQRQVMPTKSYLSQSETILTFGLADATRIDALDIQWPDGKRQTVPPPPIDALTTVTEAP